jgi:hypothetical protein
VNDSSGHGTCVNDSSGHWTCVNDSSGHGTCVNDNSGHGACVNDSSTAHFDGVLKASCSETDCSSDSGLCVSG